jgi:hypothetical protein
MPHRAKHYAMPRLLTIMRPAAPAATLVALVYVGALLTGCTAAASTTWNEDSVHGPWRTVYTGYGQVSAANQLITLSPRAARTPTVTHAALVTTTTSATDTQATVALRTTEQLRTPQPNPWEVGWVLWNYTDDAHFYYIALKPNGWEIGKEDPAYPGNQRYLATGTQPFPAQQWHEVTIHQIGATLTVSADGAPLATVTDTERPYTSGHLGLYTEDAAVDFNPIHIPS